MDLVGTCPKGFWNEWLTEGDCAGDEPRSGINHYSWKTRLPIALKMNRGDRFYVVAHGRLRGYAKVLDVVTWRGVENGNVVRWYWIYRGGGAVAVTLPITIKGFQGLRRRWWSRGIEQPFPDWKIP